ncbi:MAG: response regulator, partial [Planctomycetaceae bacterium]|nr:response regulator [Planctomycetaceae bacterium]
MKDNFPLFIIDQNSCVAPPLAVCPDVNVLETDHNSSLLQGCEQALFHLLKEEGGGIWQYDIANDEMTLSPEYFRIFRFPPTTVMTLDEILTYFVHEEDIQIARENLRQAVQFGRGFSHLAKIYNAKKEIHHIHFIGVVHCDQEGLPRKIIGLAVDVTETKQQELELEESDIRYRILFEMQNDACFLMEDSKVVTCNRKMLELFRAQDTSEVIGMTPWDLSPEWQPDGRTSRDKALDYNNQGEMGPLKPFSWVAQRLDGTEFYANVSLTKIPYQGKQLLQVLLRDVSDEYLLQQAVRENQAYLQVLAEMRRSTFRRSETEIFTAFLASVTEHFGFAKTWYGRYDSDSRTIIPTLHRGAFSHVVDGTTFTTPSGTSDEFVFPACSAVITRNSCVINNLTNSCEFLKWKHVALNGKFNSLIALPFEVNLQMEGVFVLYSKSNAIRRNVVEYLQTGLAELAKILSERRLWEEQKRLLKRSKEKAEMATEAKSRFLANMSHEIRTPMTAILGFTETLMDKENSRHKIKEIAKIIRNNSEYLLHILNDVLDYSKIEAEMLKIEMTSFSLESLLSEIHSIFSVTARKQGLDFVISNTSRYPAEIFSDHFRLKQVLLNLVGNAFKFTERGKVEIIVSWLENGNPGFGQLRLDVSDTGRGISKTVIEEIFNPFVQEDDSVTRCHEGTGLGLAISRRLIRLLCGNLIVASSQGQGSRFSIFLPQQVLPTTIWNNEMHLGDKMDAQQNPHSKSNLNPRPLEGCRVLLVDDGVDNQRLFSMILKKAGVDLTTAVNGQEAVNAVTSSLKAEKPFDVILMDVQMPVMDGLTATKILREQGVQVPIVALTAHAMREERDRCHAAGCTDFLTKPILRDALLSAV